MRLAQLAQCRCPVRHGLPRRAARAGRVLARVQLVVITSLHKVIWEEGRVAAKVFHGVV